MPVTVSFGGVHHNIPVKSNGIGTGPTVGKLAAIGQHVAVRHNAEVTIDVYTKHSTMVIEPVTGRTSSPHRPEQFATVTVLSKGTNNSDYADDAFLNAMEENEFQAGKFQALDNSENFRMRRLLHDDFGK